ncbi:hypothetical protein C3941_20860 [Kaistia algarum]|uniref:BA14K family protein n=1 Tax=Kaistia algarum TaxID=2083279 RepID=UPI000CE7A783|nr:BA14K family protein [Kaistia algarum]MCX5516065.1 BA14K family protein [Kaistia algarum]PPE77990.1 hypothetical protein C3941_20860 [Kaistia algarum]
MNPAMKTTIVGTISAAMLASSAIALPTGASAAEGVRADGSYDVAQNWQGRNWQGGPQRGWNNRGPGWRGPGYYPPRYRGWNGPGYYRGSYYNDPGAALAAGVIGLAAGAMIGSAINQPRYAAPQYGGNDYIAYCSQRYRSFNPATGTFTGYDGRKYRCVMP